MNALVVPDVWAESIGRSGDTSFKSTMCVPLERVKVTVSPALIVTMFGEKRLVGLPVATVGLAAPAVIGRKANANDVTAPAIRLAGSTRAENRKRDPRMLKTSSM